MKARAGRDKFAGVELNEHREKTKPWFRPTVRHKKGWNALFVVETEAEKGRKGRLLGGCSFWRENKVETSAFQKKDEERSAKEGGQQGSKKCFSKRIGRMYGVFSREKRQIGGQP